VSEPIDEFSFLSEQAADFGIDAPIPHAERVSLTLGDGRALSALRYGDGPPAVTFLHGAGLNAHTWDTTVLDVLFFTGPLEGKRYVDVSENALYWYFVIASWLPIYAVVYLAPRV